MGADDQIASYVVKQKMELVRSILEDLSINHNFHFSLNFSLFGTQVNTPPLFTQHLVNSTLSLPIINNFIDQMNMFRLEQLTLISLIDQGVLMYVCIDDSNKPNGIKDWVERGKVYIVDHIRKARDSKHCVFDLRDMDSSPMNGYKGSRFLQLFNKHSLN